MIRAYTIIDKDESSFTYEDNTICTYWLYLSVALIAAGSLLPMLGLTIAGLAVLLPYFLVVYFPALADARRIRSAIRNSAGEISGSRWSMSNPLRIKVRKEDAS